MDTKKSKHIAIIMDGNRRWAKKNGLKVILGHRKMTEEMVERLVDHSIKKGIEFLTLWAFSTENWKRDKKEVDDLMSLFRDMFDKQFQSLFEKGVKLNMIGNLNDFPEDLQENITKWIEKTKNNNKITVTLAMSYGGRDEIVRGIQKLAKGAAEDGFDLTQKVTPGEFSQYLDTYNLPELDMMIRPGGEKRLSGFMLWQLEYAELYFTDVLMPDFDEKEYDKALDELAKRKRRFGK